MAGEKSSALIYGLGGLPDAPELKKQEGADAVQHLWESVSRQSVQWIRMLIAIGCHNPGQKLITVQLGG